MDRVGEGPRGDPLGVCEQQAPSENLTVNKRRGGMQGGAAVDHEVASLSLGGIQVVARTPFAMILPDVVSGLMIPAAEWCVCEWERNPR